MTLLSVLVLSPQFKGQAESVLIYAVPKRAAYSLAFAAFFIKSAGLDSAAVAAYGRFAAAMIIGISLWKNVFPYCSFPIWEVELLAPLGVE